MKLDFYIFHFPGNLQFQQCSDILLLEELQTQIHN